MNFRDRLYVIRKDFKNYFKAIKSVILNYPLLKIEEVNDTKIEKLEIQRYQKGKTQFLNYDIEYIDYASFESTKRELFYHRIYDFKSNSNSPTIIDCGANICLSVLFFKELYPNASILAFEADPKVFKCLSDNVVNFKYDNVTLVNKALWDCNTTLSFYAEGADGGRIGDDKYENGDIIQVETTCLSEYILGKVDFLKIDIEGAETKVLKEIENKLHLVENIFIEFHSFTDASQTLNVILELLSKNDFRYYIANIGVKSSSQLIHRYSSLGMDNQLNVFGYKTMS